VIFSCRIFSLATGITVQPMRLPGTGNMYSKNVPPTDQCGQNSRLLAHFLEMRVPGKSHEYIAARRQEKDEPKKGA
jgi:hypothetical protein